MASIGDPMTFEQAFIGMGQKLRKSNQLSHPLDSFIHGFLFALTFAVVRYVFGG